MCKLETMVLNFGSFWILAPVSTHTSCVTWGRQPLWTLVSSSLKWVILPTSQDYDWLETTYPKLSEQFWHAISFFIIIIICETVISNKVWALQAQECVKFRFVSRDIQHLVGLLTEAERKSKTKQKTRWEREKEKDRVRRRDEEIIFEMLYFWMLRVKFL
jgi:hypothetical protein